MSFPYNHFLNKLLAGEIDLSAGDIRILLVMTNTTADTEDDTEFLDDFTDLDECDSSNYARKVLASKALNNDFANDRVAWDFADLVYTNLAPSTRRVVGAVIYRHVTDDTDSPVIGYYNHPSAFPFTPNDNTVEIQVNATGALRLSRA